MITAVILARNSAKTIERCLESIKDKVSDIVIVLDTRTTDETEQLVSHYTAKVLPFEWVNDSFSDAVNFGLSKVETEYVLYIGSDEVVTKWAVELGQDTYVVNMERDGVRYTENRLFKREGKSFYGSTHEILQGVKSETPSGICISDISKLTYEQAIEKTKLLLERHIKQLKDEPLNQSVPYYMQRCYRALGEWEHAKDYAHLSVVSDIRDDFKAQACITLYICYKYLGKPYLATEWLNRSLKFCPEQYMAKAMFYEEALSKGNRELSEKIKSQITTSKMSFDLTKEQLNKILNAQI